MQISFENLTIGVLIKAAGVNMKTIRFYRHKGLLPEPDEPYSNIHRYGEADVTRVRFVKSAQQLGLSLDEITELLRLEGDTRCEEANGLAEHKLKDVHGKMADSACMEAALSELVHACRAQKGNVSCLLIASLQDGTKPTVSAWGSHGVVTPQRALFSEFRDDPIPSYVQASRTWPGLT